MLVISRKRGTSVEIGDGVIIVEVLSVTGGNVRLGIRAAKDIPIRRCDIKARNKKSQPQGRTNEPARA
jgi:carbon storage regulator CsrA